MLLDLLIIVLSNPRAPDLDDGGLTVLRLNSPRLGPPEVPDVEDYLVSLRLNDAPSQQDDEKKD